MKKYKVIYGKDHDEYDVIIRMQKPKFVAQVVPELKYPRIIEWVGDKPDKKKIRELLMEAQDFYCRGME